MKVAQLVAAFQRFATTQNNVGDTSASQPVRDAPVKEEVRRAVEQTDPDRGDQVTVSPEAVFTFAASLYDPQQISRNAVGSLADLLQEGGAISPRDRAILVSPPEGRAKSAFFENDPNVPTNLIGEFQGRLSVDLANSNIGAVEEDTRVLSILGRLSSIREELT